MGVRGRLWAIVLFPAALLAPGASAAQSAAPSPTARVSPTPDPALEYRHALDLFEHGDYAPSAEAFGRLLYPGLRLFDPERIRRAHLYRGISLFLLDDKPGADGEFYQVLLGDPDFRPDPLFTPPAVIAAFDRLRTEHAAELKKVPRLPRDVGHDTLGIPGGASGQSGLPADFWLSVAPLGIAQFHNKEAGKGYALLLSEGALFATAWGTYLAFNQVQVAPGQFRDPGTANALKVVNNVAVAGLAGELLYGSIDGFLTASRARKARLTPAVAPGAAGLVFTVGF